MHMTAHLASGHQLLLDSLFFGQTKDPQGQTPGFGNMQSLLHLDEVPHFRKRSFVFVIHPNQLQQLSC